MIAQQLNIDNISNNLANVNTTGFKKSKAEFQDLLDHIAAENDELFVLAETLMSEDELETIYFKFKDIDMELGEVNKIELEESIANFALSN